MKQLDFNNAFLNRMSRSLVQRLGLEPDQRLKTGLWLKLAASCLNSLHEHRIQICFLFRVYLIFLSRQDPEDPLLLGGRVRVKYG